MQIIGMIRTVEKAKKTWRRPDFVFFDTAFEVTAYAGRG
ncbi:pyrroloquinoline quinone precursor peptide PqqA [Nocardia iowensis]|uniref:Coenzyme PQQ synthesis protein A n=1 Tax=Nocardia iowensis TaxID=204891 RepID=A0ABX8RG57_NOCIO|nr:pyrroloquinoline quinone precursor peptide PqqA [Nocardia iowensis]QXN88346.1 pyrroloquinoline quinone precursor peptide PqqA [Nocardia iowensis]